MIQIGFSRDMKLLRSGVLYRYLHVASHVAWSRRRSMKIVVNQLRVLPHLRHGANASEAAIFI